MASGVGVNPECLDAFQALKLRKKAKYIIYELNKTNTEIIVGKVSEDSDYEKFLQDLPEAECRWAVYDVNYEIDDGSKRQKIAFISWSPDDAKIKQKMIFASSREALKKSLTGVAVEIQATATDEVEWESLLEKVKRTGH